MKVRHFKLESGKLFVDNCGDFLQRKTKKAHEL